MALERAGPASSRTLFLQDDGSPMRFYVRPGPAKLQLAPLILAGGGRLCRVQEPGAVLLAQPGERGPTGNFVSSEYVRRCVERNERLPLEHWRLAAEPAPVPAGALAGRSAFTASEDEAILLHVRGRAQSSVTGTALWKEMERARLTPHSWQAMRDRYLRRLRGQEHKYLLGGPPRSLARSACQPADSESWRKEVAAIPQGVVQDQLTKGGSLFQLANKEFEGSESENETSDLQEEKPAKDEEPKSPEKIAFSQKMELKEWETAEVSAITETLPQEEENPIRTCPSPTEVADAVKTVQHFMEEFSMDLSTVIQAFLKNSGEAEATSYFLHNSQRLDGYPIWSRQDDLDLQKADENVRSKLIAKFGAQNVVKRVAFRKC
ncbi:telomeric repeat-binding factor 2-interacting protein 1 isoform X2 [Dermochelys coriacea]|uniref:telomeric repeat-binding factor 2-interacting protein 1 isoform X2 n=1 Tax=Dermochelys coriacea TaxID=27794 RepID=UPI0018E895DC|nr:telomeric repeat-binding factor 2-interacting protein 1 isoform X2 [Dermochelys coriacea]